jgi:hypothetical protein
LHAFTDSRPDRVPVNAIFMEMFVGHRQPTVVLTAMMRELNLKPVEHAARRQTQHPERWRLQHLDRACRELSGNLGATVGAQRADGSPFEVDLVSAENGYLRGIPLGQRAVSSARMAFRMSAARAFDVSSDWAAA